MTFADWLYTLIDSFTRKWTKDNYQSNEGRCIAGKGVTPGYLSTSPQK